MSDCESVVQPSSVFVTNPVPFQYSVRIATGSAILIGPVAGRRRRRPNRMVLPLENEIPLPAVAAAKRAGLALVPAGDSYVTPSASMMLIARLISASKGANGVVLVNPRPEPTLKVNVPAPLVNEEIAGSVAVDGSIDVSSVPVAAE